MRRRLAAPQIARRQRVVLEASSLQLATDTLHWICGRNGSGKTTLLEAWAGLLPGVPRAAPSVALHSPEMRTPFPYTGWEWLAATADRPENPSLWAHAELIFALPELYSRSVTQLSSGEWTRLSLARTLRQDAVVTLWDEPLAHLDPDTAGNIVRFAASLPASYGRMLIATTHDIPLASAVVSELIVICERRLIHGSWQGLVQNGALSDALGVPYRATPYGYVPWHGSIAQELGEP